MQGRKEKDESKSKTFLSRLNTKFKKEIVDDKSSMYFGSSSRVNWDNVRSECDSLKNNSLNTFKDLNYDYDDYNDYNDYTDIDIDIDNNDLYDNSSNKNLKNDNYNYDKENDNYNKENDNYNNENNNYDKENDNDNYDNAHVILNNQKYKCNLCCDKVKGSLIILDCNHTFHIQCVVERSFTDDSPIVDIEFIKNTKCNKCNNSLDTSELMYIHDKYYNLKEDDIKDYSNKIKVLEIGLEKKKSELREYLEKKQKLEYSRDKSKRVALYIKNL